jgi:MFS family permease
VPDTLDPPLLGRMIPAPTDGPVPFPPMDRSLRAVLIGTFALRFATGLTGAMLSAYLAKLSDQGNAGIDAKTVGLLAATFYVSELALSPLFGVVSDRWGLRRVMIYGQDFGAVAVLLMTLSAHLGVLGGARLLQGASTAASIPSILGFIALATAGNEVLRGKASARFEGATLAGLGAGFILATKAFEIFGTTAFILNALVYVVAFLIYMTVREPAPDPSLPAREPVNLGRYLELVGHSHVLLLAPTWIAVNAAIGLWFSQSLYQFNKADPRFPDQWLLQGFSANQITVGAIVIAIVFGAGILWWGNRFDRFRRTSIILFGILGGLALVVAGLIVNHGASSAGSSALIGALVVVAVAIVGLGLFVLAGATPAAVGLLADVSEKFPADRGAIMGLYSVFLGVGQIGGSLIGGVAADWRGMDGLLLGTGALLLVALIPLARLRGLEHHLGPGLPSIIGDDK